MVSQNQKKVCVVGAGVSGLVSARELRREGHVVTVMEQSGGVGGQWLYEPKTDGSDPLGLAGVHSGIYASLRLIIPREVMCFSDFPFYPMDNGGDGRRYPGHGEFLRYIQDFCDTFGLMDAIRLNTTVQRVAMADEPSRWVVRSCTRRGDDGEAVVTEEVFDAVVVAVSQFAHPRLPTIDGMDKWQRKQLHSHSYRVPDSFRGEVVVLVGCHESGKDIALDICKVARDVYLSVKSVDDVEPGVHKAVSRHQNLHLRPQIERLREDGTVVFADGASIDADTIIYCTGYEFSYPFLDTGGVVTVDDNRVGGQWLYDPRIDGGDSLGLAGVHSSIYASLRPLIPREVMSSSDFPFYPCENGGDSRRYPGHSEFHRYMRDFCDAFGLMDAVSVGSFNALKHTKR